MPINTQPVTINLGPQHPSTHGVFRLRVTFDGEQVIVDQTELINEFGLLRNQFLGVLKALEAKQFQINNIVKLRVAGLEDSEINMFYGNPNK